MKLPFNLAIKNIRRYPLRILGNALCLLLFGFAMFSAVIFSQSLKNTISEVLKQRSSGNIALIKCGENDIDIADTVSELPDVLETAPYYPEGVIFGKIAIDGVGEFDINLDYKQSQTAQTLIPKVYFDEFYALGNSEFLVAGKFPENENEMIICENFCKNSRILNYDDILNKTATVSRDFFPEISQYEKTFTYFEDVKIVGIFSEDFLNINALSNEKSDAEFFGSTTAFLVNPKCKLQGIIAYTTIDKIDDVCEILSEKYSVIKTVYESDAIEKLSGLRTFITNLMLLAAGAAAFIYLMTRLTSAMNYFREKSPFITAADAFGCKKSHILAAFAIENLILLLPASIISALLGCTFIRFIFRIISSYLKIEFSAKIDYSAVFSAFLLMILTEFLILFISFLLFRKSENN